MRLAPGRFVAEPGWSASTPAARHRARLRAVLPTVAERLIISHASAAAVHELPWVGEFPSVVTFLDPERRTGQRRTGVRKVGAAGRVVSIDRWCGAPVTALAATAVDIALEPDRRSSLIVLDAVLRRGVRSADLTRELHDRPTPRAVRRAGDLVALAAPEAESPGESATRLLMHDLGAPTPLLQARFTDARGTIGIVDFWFPDQGVIVEFDGLVKYRSPTVRAGRTPEQVVIEEKRREDRLRSVPGVRAVVRFVWADIMPGGAAPAVLARMGLLPSGGRARRG
ncbi:hypothetical protein DEI86_08115 [Curtobacterium sp. MCBD17_028]|nr:hypothetical protein DEI86_08115 [Curtobacterium sp. MCBD17_028]